MKTEIYNNSHCIERASAAMDTYRCRHVDGSDARLFDLLADLRHWCDANGIDFDAESSRALEFWKEETNWCR